MPLYNPDRQDRDRETGTQGRDRERGTQDMDTERKRGRNRDRTGTRTGSGWRTGKLRAHVYKFYICFYILYISFYRLCIRLYMFYISLHRFHKGCYMFYICFIQVVIGFILVFTSYTNALNMCWQGVSLMKNTFSIRDTPLPNTSFPGSAPPLRFSELVVRTRTHRAPFARL